MGKVNGERTRDYIAGRVAYFFTAACAVLCVSDIAVWYFSVQSGRGYVLAIVLTVVFATFLIAAKLLILNPYREAERMLALFSTGYSTEGVSNLRCQMSPGVEGLVDRIEDMLSSDEALNISKRQAQYLAMQNQINPHFLYNTLEGIRGEALTSGAEEIAKMTESLSQFFRYTISNLERLVTFDDELTNVRNYCHIQEYRFGERLKLEIEFENDDDRGAVLNAKVPKLILQPVVENAIIHGIEELPGTGLVRILVQYTGSRIIITVSDNGVGMSPARLRELNDNLANVYGRFEKGAREDEEGGIALANVSNRIKLLFGEDYGLVVTSSEDVGTDVEITLPYITRYGDAEQVIQ
jgi:two-component system sensor histidine kinase YesM